MKFDLLWTDTFFLILMAIATAFVLKSTRQLHIKKAYRTIFKNSIAASSAVILLFFLCIAVLDSIRFIPAKDAQPVSVLDTLLAPLGEVYEKTYSAPFARHLFTSETVLEQGQAKQVYPKLRYVPASLQSTKAVWHLIGQDLGLAFAVAVAIVLALWLLAMGLRKITKHDNPSFKSQAGITGFLTLLVALTLTLSLYWLSRDFHVLGTGKIGQDIFYYAVKSIRTGLIIGTLTTLFMMPLALILGISAGYFGGIADDIIQYIYTTLSSIPGVLLITASVLSMQTYIANHPGQFTTLAQRADARLLALCLILGVTSWTSLCRLLRAESLKLREIDYVLAAKALGSRSFKIISKHLLPNVMHIVLITLVLDFSFLVLAEAVLSYVGVGVSPLTMSWGNMINAARLELAREPIVWWPVLAAFLFMFTLVLASNLFADAVRDAFDPRKSSAA